MKTEREKEEYDRRQALKASGARSTNTHKHTLRSSGARSAFDACVALVALGTRQPCFSIVA